MFGILKDVCMARVGIGEDWRILQDLRFASLYFLLAVSLPCAMNGSDK